jgi:hypothetical protein
MVRKALTILSLAALFLLFAGWVVFLRGSGGLSRMVSLTGITPVCRPGGYDVVCFQHASEPGISCVPLNGALCR